MDGHSISSQNSPRAKVQSPTPGCHHYHPTSSPDVAIARRTQNTYGCKSLLLWLPRMPLVSVHLGSLGKVLRNARTASPYPSTAIRRGESSERATGPDVLAFGKRTDRTGFLTAPQRAICGKYCATNCIGAEAHMSRFAPTIVVSLMV